MTDQPAKKSPMRKVIVVLVILLFIAAIGVAVYFAVTSRIDAVFHQLNETNSSLIEVNQTTNIVNNDNRGQENFWGAIVKIVLGLFSLFTVAIGLKWWIEQKKTQIHTKEECINAAREDLLAAGYPVDERRPKFDFQYAGADSEANPRWAFAFIETGFDNTQAFIIRYHLISCVVHAKTLEVTNPEHGRSWDETLEQLNLQRKGRWALMNDAGKPEREASLEDLFQQKQPRVSLDVTPEGEQ